MPITPTPFGGPGGAEDNPDYVTSTSPASGSEGVAEEIDKLGDIDEGIENRVVLDETAAATVVSADTLGTANNPVTTATAARPQGLAVVYWYCAAQPTNWVAGDVWDSTAATTSTNASGDLTGTYPGPTVAKIQGTTIATPSGTTTTFLNGTGAWSTPAGSIAGVTVSGTPATGQVLTATSTSAASWATPLTTSEFTNVRTYGALGNGTTDDTTAIQAALTAASANTGVVFFPPGTYKITATLNVPSGVLLFANNVLGKVSFPTTVIQQGAGANLASMVANAGWIANTTSSADTAVSMYGICLDGNSTNQTSGSGHGFVSSSWRTRVENCTISNMRGDGIRFSSVMADGTSQFSSVQISESRVHRCVVYNCGGNGISVIEGTNLARVTDGFISETIVYQTTGYGIYMMQGGGWLLSANHVYGTGNASIHVERASTTRIFDNYVEFWGSTASIGNAPGIYVLLGWDCVLTGNMLNGYASWVGSGNTPFGIYCENFSSSEAHLLMTNNAALYNGTAAGTGIRVVVNGTTTLFYLVGKGTNTSEGYTTAATYDASLVTTGGIIV